MIQEKQPTPLAIFFMHADGASWGNPGDAGYGALITDAEGNALAETKGYLGKTTNNVAEYQALIHGLEKALALGMRRIHVRMDSQLVVAQIRGTYRVRQPHLKPLHQKAQELLARFAHFEIDHVPRELNHRADRLANEAIEEHLKKR